MLKFALILLAIVGVAYWWIDSRQRAVRRELRERNEPRLAQPLVRCPHCGAYKVKGARCCDGTGRPRG